MNGCANISQLVFGLFFLLVAAPAHCTCYVHKTETTCNKLAFEHGCLET